MSVPGGYLDGTIFFPTTDITTTIKGVQFLTRTTTTPTGFINTYNIHGSYYYYLQGRAVQLAAFHTVCFALA